MIQFRLRTLMIVVTLLGVALGINGYIQLAAKRHQWLGQLVTDGGDYQPFLSNEPQISFVRRWCGDRPIVVIWIPLWFKPATVAEFKTTFPESQFLEK